MINSGSLSNPNVRLRKQMGTKVVNNGKERDDVVMTPEYLTKQIIEYFKPTGNTLEPCRGSGNFFKYMPNADWCEIKEGRDFFEYDKKVEWIITNPPYSLLRKFLQKSMEVSDNIVFLCPWNHLTFTARLRDMRECGFGIKEVTLIHYPDNFPKMGFALSVIHIQKKYSGDIKFKNEFKFNKPNDALK